MEQVPVAEVVVPVAEVASAEDAQATLLPSKLVPALRSPGEADAHQASSSSSSRAPEEGHVPSSLPPISTARSSHSGNGAHGDSNKADVVDGDMDFTDAFPGNEGAAARLKERQRTERNRKREEERLEEEARRLREGEHKERRRLQQLRKLEKHVQSEEAEAKKAKEDLDRRIEEEQRLKNDEGSKAQQREALVRIRARRVEVDKKNAKDRAEMEALAFAKAKKELGQDLARKRLAHYSPRQRRLSSVTRQRPPADGEEQSETETPGTERTERSVRESSSPEPEQYARKAKARIKKQAMRKRIEEETRHAKADEEIQKRLAAKGSKDQEVQDLAAYRIAAAKRAAERHRREKSAEASAKAQREEAERQTRERQKVYRSPQKIAELKAAAEAEATAIATEVRRRARQKESALQAERLRARRQMLLPDAGNENSEHEPFGHHAAEHASGRQGPDTRDPEADTRYVSTPVVSQDVQIDVQYSLEDEWSPSTLMAQTVHALTDEDWALEIRIFPEDKGQAAKGKKSPRR